ncbi:hypothetical protein HY486_04175 [Candidatus Woesearchaeota archaeon]|nr:hypothetical protein [Candidatus Woesearchaeota archaeon]
MKYNKLKAAGFSALGAITGSFLGKIEGIALAFAIPTCIRNAYETIDTDLDSILDNKRDPYERIFFMFHYGILYPTAASQSLYLTGMAINGLKGNEENSNMITVGMGALFVITNSISLIYESYKLATKGED